MVSSFSVRPEQVDVLASDIAADAKSIAQELENLNSQVSALIGQWDGSAREAYHQAQRKLQEMNQILGQISQATSQIAQQYVESDARSAGRF